MGQEAGKVEPGIGDTRHCRRKRSRWVHSLLDKQYQLLNEDRPGSSTRCEVTARCRSTARAGRAAWSVRPMDRRRCRRPTTSGTHLDITRLAGQATWINPMPTEQHLKTTMSGCLTAQQRASPVRRGGPAREFADGAGRAVRPRQRSVWTRSQFGIYEHIGKTNEFNGPNRS